MEDEKSWFFITPTLEHRKRLAVFGPEDVTPVSRTAFGGAGDAETYTPTQLSEFWDSFFLSALLQGKLFKNSLENSTSPTQQFMDENNILNMQLTNVYVDDKISPDCIKNQVSGHFWINCLRFGILWNLFPLLFVHQANRRPHSYCFKTYRNSPSY